MINFQTHDIENTSNRSEEKNNSRDLLSPQAMLLRDFLSPQGFPGGSDGKESACNAGDLGLIPGSRRPLGEGSGYPIQYSCWENSRDRGAWWAKSMGSEIEYD